MHPINIIIYILYNMHIYKVIISKFKLYRFFHLHNIYYWTFNRYYFISSFFYVYNLNSEFNLIYSRITPLFVFLCENYDIVLIYRTINMTRVLLLLKAYKIIELFQGEEKSVYSQIIYIIITLIIMLLIWAGIIQMSDLGYVIR